MSRFIADTLDLSRLPSPTVIKSLDYEVILSERLADFKRRWPGWDQGSLETDPAVILQEADAFRELLDKQRINEAARAVMLPFAEKSDLDVIGSLFGVARMIGEEDTPYRRRIALAPEAYASAGSAGGYAFHALSVSTTVVDVGVTSPSPGVAEVVILCADGTDPEVVAALVSAVNARLQSNDIRPLTDHVVVMAADVVPYAITAHLVVPPGPDPSVVAAAARTSLLQLAGATYRVGRSIDASEISGAAWSSNARRVDASPAGVVVTRRQAPRCSSVTVTTEVAGA